MRRPKAVLTDRGRRLELGLPVPSGGPGCDEIEGDNTGERGDRDSGPDPSAWAHALRGTGQSHCFFASDCDQVG